MVRTAAVVSWAALVLGHVHAIPTLLAHSATIDGHVLIRDPLMLHASDSTPASADCKLGDWEPASECDLATLTQVFVRKAVVAPEGNGTPCTDIRATRKCKPVHCQMGPWSMWTDCVVGGYRTRSRKMIQAPLYGGRECPHAEDKVKCRPEDCLVCAWGPWTCDPTTGNKTRSRRVERPAQLTGRKCPPLTDVEPCDPIDCVLSQDEYDDEWSECDEKGNKHKNRTILVHPLYNGKACPPSEETWKTDVGACRPEDCVVQNEEDAAYGECAQRESDKKWYKIKVLNVTKPAKYGGNCPSEANRTREAECPPEPCVMGNWTFEGDCKANGKRTRTRKVVKQAKYGADACTEEEDEATDKDTCPPVDCQLQTESEVDFGNCTSIDGKSYAKNKTLVIKIPAQYGGNECNETSKVITVICNPVDCVMSDWTFEGECEDNGKRKRTRTVLQQAQNGAAECKPEEDYAPDPKTCPPQNCILDDASTCSFGECTLGENNIWVKTKVITIKTPAKFGGVDCPSEGNRTITQVCDPVPCTMSSWMFVGSCNERGERKKIRTVKAQGKYGAPACKNQFKYERDPTGCPATDCVLSTTEWTAWGECIKGMKKRTSKIVTPAKYGGNCVPKEDTANCGIDNRTS